ncbi:MAG: hypothetical protein KDB07_12300, partial [Planctomycetes bacterium]|nr:hypothetical protein [Planctomycetota bacterium]
RALSFADEMMEHFYDAEQGGFFRTRADAADVLVRQKDDYDGAEPSGNALAAEVLLRLGHLLGRSDLWKAGERTLAAFGNNANQSPTGHTRYLCALDFFHATKREIVIAAATDDAAAAMLDVVGAAHLPNTLLVQKRADNAAALAKLLPWTEAMELPSEGALAYVCEGFACQLPIFDPDALAKALGG